MDHDAYWEAVLDGKHTREVAAHRQWCHRCAAQAQALEEIRGLVLEAVPPPPPGLAERVLEQKRQRAERERPAHPRSLAMPKRWSSLLRIRLRLVAMAVAALLAVATITVLPAGDKAVALSPFTASCPPADGGHDQQRLVVAGVWSGAEQENFAKVLERFSDRTGAKVTFASTGRRIAEYFDERLRARVERGCPPDVALLPQPGLLADLAHQGALRPIEDVAGAAVDANYAQMWRQLGTVSGTLYGVWFKAANKSTIWYNTKAFEAAGVRPPTTWEELKGVAAALAEAGTTPFSVAGADGWTLTDWFENVYLRTAGPDLYDRLARHQIPWTHSSVKRALTVLAEVLGVPNWVAGGPTGALATDYETSVRQVFADRPRAAMVYEGDFVATVAQGSGATVGKDASFFPFPAIGGSKPAVVAAGGDVAVVLSDNPAARELARFLATPEAAEPWARAGGFLSPNRGLDANVYADDTTRKAAEALVRAEVFRYDLSDLQPAAFGALEDHGLRQILQDYLRNPADVDGIARRLEVAAAAAWAAAGPLG